jgi:hypothetical protein
MTEKGAEQTCDAKLVLLGNSGTRRPFSLAHMCPPAALCGTPCATLREQRKKRKKTKNERKK